MAEPRKKIGPKRAKMRKPDPLFAGLKRLLVMLCRALRIRSRVPWCGLSGGQQVKVRLPRLPPFGPYDTPSRASGIFSFGLNSRLPIALPANGPKGGGQEG